MPRIARISPGNLIYHVLNRANAGLTFFESPAEFELFRSVLAESLPILNMRLLAYSVLPTHWHLVVQPRKDGDLGVFMQRLTTTHVRRWVSARKIESPGHLYQGRFRCFPVQRNSERLAQVARFVERQPVELKLARKAENWEWSSAWQRQPDSQTSATNLPELTPWPVGMPRQWASLVNKPLPATEMEEVLRSLKHDWPLGEDAWVRATAVKLGRHPVLRPRGRPRKKA